MKYKDPITGEYKTIHMKTSDTLPIGTIVSFEGDEIPEGYAEVLGEEARVVISPTEPTTGEEVWIQKGKNLFENNMINSSANRLKNSIPFNVLGNTTYTVNAQGTNIQVYIEFFDANSTIIQTTEWSNLPFTFTTNKDVKYLNLYIRFADNSNIALTDVSNIQIEQGDTATDYEAYIEKKIHIKNANGIYEEFYKNNGIVESGSNANGSYVKFDDGTMICKHRGTYTNISINSAYGSLYLGRINFVFPQTFIEAPEVSCSEVDFGGLGAWGSTQAITESLVNIRLYDVTSRSAGTPCTVGYIAIGKWK